MKLIKHLIPVEIGNGEKIIINSLNGRIDKLSLTAYEIVDKWKGVDNIAPENEVEAALLTNLNSRGYLVNSHDEEFIRKKDLVAQLREADKKQKETCKHITFILTYNCNFRCPYCFEGESTLKREIISPEQIDAALRLAGDNLESVGLFGGEPLMPSNRSSLEYLFSKTKDKPINITTNGYFLEEFFDILFPLKFIHVTVTLDGEENTHNSRRYLVGGKPTYDKIMRGVKKYLENGMPIHVRMNIERSNFEEAHRLRQSLIDEFEHFGKLLSFEMGTVFGIPNEDKTEIITKTYLGDINYSPEERLRRNALFGRNNSIINNITAGEELKPTYSFCIAHSNSFLVDPYGLIYTCIPSVGKPQLSISMYYPNIEFKKKSIYTRNIETISECKECVYSLLCGGGCPLGNMACPDDIMKPECFSIKNQVHNLLPKFYNMNIEAERHKGC